MAACLRASRSTAQPKTTSRVLASRACSGIGAGIEKKIGVGEIAVTRPDLAGIGLGARRQRRQQETKAAYLAAVEARNEGHRRLLAAIEDVDELARQDAAVDRADWAHIRPAPRR